MNSTDTLSGLLRRSPFLRCRCPPRLRSRRTSLRRTAVKAPRTHRRACPADSGGPDPLFAYSGRERTDTGALREGAGPRRPRRKAPRLQIRPRPTPRRTAEDAVGAGQELVIGGYTPSPKSFDALVIGHYDGDRLISAERTRNGFTPASRVELFEKLKPLEIKECPFANLPEKKAGRWGAGLTASKMAECRRLKQVTIAQFEFVEGTSDSHLRHNRFVALREDKKAKDVRRK
jgi:hypothetical protein